MRRTLLLSILIALCIPMLGNPVDENTAKQLAQNFRKENNIMGVKGDKVFKKRMDDARFVNVAPLCGYTEFYIFNNEDSKGFVIISADDCVTPILGYSYDNNFVTENLPPNLKCWLDGYAEQIRTAVEMRATATDEIMADWERLRQEKNLPIRSETAVNPLITTHWDQSPYYNALCPVHPTYGQTVTGCVATAMAQIMKYWSYPEHGYGSNQYTPTQYPELGLQYADFSGTTFQWSQMPTTLYNNNDAVATLMYYCGVSVNMNYGVGYPYDDGSSAYIISYDGYLENCAENALKTFFDYKNTLQGLQRINYADSQWITLLKNELNNSRPILYGGFGTGGHAFVCDGYNNSNYFHFNWGWGGESDGHFAINNLNPNPFGQQQNYSNNQVAIIGIEPNNTTYNFDLVYYSTPEMSDDEYWFFDDLSVYAEVWNVGSGAFNGYIGAGIYYEEDPGSGTYYFLDIMDYWDRTSTPLPGTYYVYGDLDCAGGPPYIPGSYAVAMLYSMDCNTWNLIDKGSYDYAYFDIVSSYAINTHSDFSIITNNGVLYQNTDATINVDLINAGSETFYGKFRVNLSNSDGSWVQNIGILECNNGLPANYHYTNGLDFTGTITAPSGTYLLELAYQYEGSSNWYYAGASDYQNPVWVYVAPEPIYADPYEPNNSQNLAYSFTPSFSGNTATINTTGSNLHNSSDVDYYKINLNAGYDYTITPRLHDAFNSGNGNTYSVDGMFAYSTDGVNWSQFYDDVMTGNFSIIDGGMVYFDVISYFEGDIGTYLLSVGITRTQHANDYIISVSANPSNGGSVSGGGTFTQGQTCTVNATANSGYTFVNWTESGTQVSTNPSYSFTVNSNRNLVANFQAQQQQYTITVSASPNNGGSVSGGGTFAQGQTCTVNATANSGYTFVNWTENGTQVSTNPSYSFTVNSNRVLVANFQAQSQQYSISVSASPSDGGNVSGGGTFTQGQTCTVNATANSGYTFVNWTENGTQVSTNTSYTFTVTGNRNLVANFQAQPQQYTISVSANPSNGGSVSGGGTFTQGQTCTVNATANSGYTFVNWTENGTQVSTNASYSFTVTDNRNLVANFAQNTYTITATAGANGFITPSGTVVIAEGSNQSFTIIPDYGYEIYEVYVDGGLIGAPSSYTFQNVTSNHTIFATFIRIDGIDDNNGMAFVIYPNPTSGIVNILCHDAELFNIYNTYGQLLISQNTNGNDQVTIDISNLPSSIYLIQLVSKEGFATKQIIKIP